MCFNCVCVWGGVVLFLTDFVLLLTDFGLVLLFICLFIYKQRKKKSCSCVGGEDLEGNGEGSTSVTILSMKKKNPTFQ